MSEYEDELAIRLSTGDEQALAELFSIHRPRLQRMVQFRLHPKLSGRVDPDDVVQEAYLDAVKRIQSYAEDGSNSALVWLRMVLGQTLVDLHRRHLGAKMRDIQQEVGLSAPPAHGSASMSSILFGSLTSPSQAAMRAEASEVIEKVLDGMDPIDREVLVLRHFEELTNKEVAETLGLQMSAASNRYVRALTRLKGALSGLPGLGGYENPPAPDPAESEEPDGESDDG